MGSGQSASRSQRQHAAVGDGRHAQQQDPPPAGPAPAVDQSPYRPAAILTTIVSNSPRLIGWDDEKMQRLAREAAEEGRRERMELRRQRRRELEGDGASETGAGVATSEEEEGDLLEDDLARVKLGPDETERDALQEIGFGLLGIAADTVTDYLLRSDEKDEVDGGGPSGGDGSSAPHKTSRVKISSDDEQKSALGGSAEDAIESSASADTAAAAGDGKTMRDMELYKFALNSIRWQRDAYLVGTTYADTRRRQRRTEDESDVPTAAMLRRHMESGEPSLGKVQLTQLGKTLLPSEMTRSALLPTVLWLPSPNGPFNVPFSRAVTNLIPMSQPNLDYVMKDSILWVLKDENWRRHVKYGAGSYVTNMRRDGSG